MDFARDLKAQTLTKISAPVVTLVSAVVVMGIGLVILWRLHLLGTFFASSGFQITAFVLALLAIIFGCIQFWDSRRLPRDMDEIIDVISRADQELLFVSDFTDYGSYSSPETHQRLLQAVTKARGKGVCVRWLVYGEKPAQETMLRQFKETDFFHSCKSTKFQTYFKYWSGVKVPANHVEFLKLLREKADALTNDLLDKGVEIHTLSEKVWLFFFIQDKQDAVFLFEDIGTDDKGLACRTRDAKLVETFCGIFDRNWNLAPPKDRAPRQSGALG